MLDICALIYYIFSGLNRRLIYEKKTIFPDFTYRELFCVDNYLLLWFVFEQASFIKVMLNHFYKIEKASENFPFLQVRKAFQKIICGVKNQQYLREIQVDMIETVKSINKRVRITS